jgi:hypothetical protein
MAGVRVSRALKRLKRDEREACRALWSEVDALLNASGSQPVRTIR